ncbi:lysophospholipid acyltransferase family protein [Anaerosacchariphilus polymeriproducens]|uniref:1-acyl-sn-glycerol-3-phosphate acyltransferase n=1 Tax=Anaerosacchariphilus polymeriproducens TaxID=1812858 RepID=A0A371AV53_9FIRM|nr:lysophospholipid acyltransferase family protein [Anaerosacchariphilus polymeriproducens]RDU23455.1 1-acyl-sn-glycerol-3-phosphate acyltransferase [Anaerosacchariphilus polymeriproducens]
MIRFLLIAAFLILYLVLTIPILIIEWILGKFNKPASDMRSLRLVQWAFRLMLKIAGTQITVIGEENVPANEPVLYVANHSSYFDILLTYSRCPGLTGYIAKKSMEKTPLLSNWMKRLHCLFLDRDNIKEGLKTILIGIEKVKQGISICIFPEGTRNYEKELLPFKEGSLKIAEKSGCAIIPIAITNSSEIFEKHFPRIKSCKVVLEYGKPIYPKTLDKQEQKFLGAYTQKKIQEMLDKNKID